MLRATGVRAVVGVALALVVASLSSGAGPATAAPGVAGGSEASISGTIRDAAGRPLDGDGLCVSAQGLTVAGVGADGHYSLVGLPAGAFRVGVRPCFDADRDELQTYYPHSLDAAGASPVVVGSGQARTGIDIRTVMGSSIRGHVYAGAGTAHPLGGICATAYAADPGQAPGSYTASYSHADGSYVVHSVPTLSGGYQLALQDCNDQPTYLGAVAGGGATIHPTPEAPVTGLDGHLTTGGSIAGIVRDSAGRPITDGGACVQLAQHGYWDGPQADADGRFSFTALEPGTYRIVAKSCTYHGTRTDQTVGRTVVVDDTGTVTVDITLPAGTSMSGTTFEGAGTAFPATNACTSIWLKSAPPPFHSPVEFVGASSDGRWSIRGLKPDREYLVEFAECNITPYPELWFSGGTSIDSATTVVPTVAHPLVGIDGHFDVSGRAPRSRIVLGPASGFATRDRVVDVRFDADRPGATFTCRLDEADWAPCASPYVTDALPDGRHRLGVKAHAGGRDEADETVVGWTVDPTAPSRTYQGQVAPGETFRTDPDRTPDADEPQTAAVTLPTAGQVTVVKRPDATTDVAGATAEGTQLDVIARRGPEGSDDPVTAAPADPIALTLAYAAGSLPDGIDPHELTTTRDGVTAADCVAPGVAEPDPCVARRADLPDGGLAITTLTTHLSTWDVALRPSATPPAPAPVRTATQASPAPAPAPPATTTDAGTPTTAPAPSTPPAGITPPVAPTPGATPTSGAVRIGTTRRLRLAAFLRSGMTVRVVAPAPGRATVTVALAKGAARRLGIRTSASSVTIGSTSHAVGTAKRALRVRVLPRYAGRLARAGTITLAVSVGVRSAGGRTATARTRVAVRR